jgi:KaiC/GvpD/RAD55 family RecA-like ATPase
MPAKGQAAFQLSLAFEGLPQELAEFLSRDTYSLLIKGDSGTGKTILALTILKALRPIENLLYISTRTSPLQLLENYPWIEETFGAPGAPQGSGGKETEGYETLVDARLDEPNTVFERITNVLMDKQAPTVVIDTWESLSDTLGSEALRTNIRVLQTWRERAGARFVFVGENPGNTTIDFMVEGVVVLKDRASEARRLREIVISKLHGVQIPRPSHFFTLEGGTFRSFPNYLPRDYAFRKPLPVKFDKPFPRVSGHFPTGYAPLDALLDGGYPAKSVAVVEVDRKVDPRVVMIFLSRMFEDWVAAGDSVLLYNPPDLDRQFISQYLKSFAGGGRKGQIIVSEAASPTETKLRSLDKGFVELQDSSRKGRSRRLAILWRGPRGSDSWDASQADLKALKQKTDLAMIIGKSGSLGFSDAEQAGTYLKLVEIEGTLFVQSDAPWSPLYAVVPARTGGNPTMKLEPVV